MPQQLDDLIFDRTQSDVSRVQSLTQKMIAGTATEAEKAEWLGGKMKGAYNASDLNRVCAAVDYLTGVLTGLGYSVTTTLPEKKPVYTAKEIEYIESTGTQYIDTLFKPNQNTRVVCDFELLESGKAYGVFGARIGYGDTSYDLFAFGMNAETSFQDDYGTSNNAPTNSQTNVLYHADKNKNVTSLGNVSRTFSASTFQLNYTMYLFGVNTSGSPNNQLGSLRIYSCKIYDNGALVRDFKPYYDSNGVACLFDAVSGTYYYNAGTGAFTASEEPTLEMAYWSENDFPMQAQMEQYLANVAALRDRLPYVAPDAPASMEGLTYQEANDIEEILYTLEDVQEAMQAAFLTRQANTLFMIAGGVFNNV